MSGRRLSWSGGDDRVWGPFLYSHERRGYRPFGIEATSGDGEDYPGARLRFSGFGHTFIVALPQWLLKPYRKKVDCSHWDEATIKRLGRAWYWAYTRREYGFSVSQKAVHIHYGRQTDSWPGQKSICWFIPWLQWRFVRTSHYTPQGEHIRTFPAARRKSRKSGDGVLSDAWKLEREFEETLPTVDFKFSDYDDEVITAYTRIEEREWRLGEGWFKWLSWFASPKIDRTLDLSFSAEVGKEKGSWKGGTTGHAVKIAVGETPESAFRRYCVENEMTFEGEA